MCVRALGPKRNREPRPTKDLKGNQSHQTQQSTRGSKSLGISGKCVTYTQGDVLKLGIDIYQSVVFGLWIVGSGPERDRGCDIGEGEACFDTAQVRVMFSDGHLNAILTNETNGFAV